MNKRLPSWLTKHSLIAGNAHVIKQSLRGRCLHTVCEEARCPNIGECFARGTATIMIMGNICTRHCGFCSVKHGLPQRLDPDEPHRVAGQVKEMGLHHAVITSVTRDDLSDGGAAHFAATIAELRALCPQTTIEVLTPDFGGKESDVRVVCGAGPDVFNHNIETVERLTPEVRDKANYHRSLDVLLMARKLSPSRLIKSGIMVGLGESLSEVESALGDLKSAGCDIITIGQYLRPTKKSLPVAEYVAPEIFHDYKQLGLKLGIKHVFSGPFVRSSYLADKVFI